MAYRHARSRDTRTGRPATRTVRSVGEGGGGKGEEQKYGTSPDPQDVPRAPRTHDQGTAPAKAVVAHSATNQPHSYAARGGPTGNKPVARARRPGHPG